ncbi:class A beta-lactamase [Rhodococcus sp. NPDC058521]|uniref:class A beta-lactamase n=1 Tax=Rhodococcus sp. NPDC058521 TaxID=3346536 RepID=UPI00365BE65F
MTWKLRPARTAIALAASLPLVLGGCAAADSSATEAPNATAQSTTSVERSTDIERNLDPVMGDLEIGASARVGIAAVNTVTGESYEHRADESFALCSTFKTYAAAEVLRRARAGATSLDKHVTIEPGKVVENSPVTGPAAGTSMPLAQIARAALTHSDNTAGNYLLEEIGGPPAVTAIAREMGDDTTRLDRWETDLNEALRGDPRDTSTPGELADGYEKLLLGDGLFDADRERLVDWMRESTTSEQRIRAALPPGWSAADKTGGGSFGTANDAGVVWSPSGEPIVLVILTDSTTNRADEPANNRVISEAAAAVIDALGS